MKPIEWRTDSSGHGPAIERAYIARMRIGSVYRALRTKGEAVSYSFSVLLPGIATHLSSGVAKTEEEAKERFTKIATAWFKETE